MLAAAAIASRIQGFAPPPGTGVTIQDLGEGALTLVSLGAILVIAAVLAFAAEVAEDQMSII